MNDEALAMANYLIDEVVQDGGSQLDLSGCGLTAVPERVFELIFLTHLSLRGNKLTEIPEQIGRLNKLVQLSIANNQLKGLPAVLGKLTELTHLNAKRNQLTSLPFEIVQLDKLEMLQLQENHLPIPDELLAKWDRPDEIIAYYREHHLQALAEETAVEPLSLAARLHWVLAERFTAEELDELCTDLCLPEPLTGDSHAERAHELIAFHETHGLLDDFTFLLRQLRPSAFTS